MRPLYYLAVFIATLLLPVSVQAETIESSFDMSDEGWGLSGGNSIYLTKGGNPGGYIQADDGIGSEMLLTAPRKFLGDLSSFNGGSIAFDASEIENPNGPGQFIGFVTIVGTDATGNESAQSNQATATPSSEPDTTPPSTPLKFSVITSDAESASLDQNTDPLPSWTTYSISLMAGKWGMTESRWSALLADVAEIKINIVSGSEVSELVGFDNFRIIGSAYKQGSIEQPKIVELLFIRKTDSGPEEIKEISYDEPFYIKAVFDSQPEEDKKTVTLDWGEGADKQKKIIVERQTDNKKIYLSDAIYAKRPTSKEGE